MDWEAFRTEIKALGRSNLEILRICVKQRIEQARNELENSVDGHEVSLKGRLRELRDWDKHIQSLLNMP